MRCLHCYEGARPRRGRPTELELRARIDKIFAFCSALHVSPCIHLSGGEPTLRADLARLVEYVTCVKGGEVLLLTNGTRWTPELHDSLCQAGLRYVQVSLEGCEELNDQSRGQGVFRTVIATIERLVCCGYRVTVSVTVTQLNVLGLEAFIRELDPLGVHFHVREVLPLGSGMALPSLTPAERKRFLSWALGHAGRSSLDMEDPIRCNLSHGDSSTGGCVAGRSHFCIDVEGTVFPCRPLGIPVGTVEDLDAAWTSSTMRRLRTRELEGQRDGCRVHSLITSGNLFGEDDHCFGCEEGSVRSAFEQGPVDAATNTGDLVLSLSSRLRRIL